MRNVGAWLWKTAANTAQDRWRAEYAVRAGDKTEIDGLAAPDAETECARKEREALDDLQRAERRLLYAAFATDDRREGMNAFGPSAAADQRRAGRLSGRTRNCVGPCLS